MKNGLLSYVVLLLLATLFFSLFGCGTSTVQNGVSVSQPMSSDYSRITVKRPGRFSGIGVKFQVIDTGEVIVGGKEIYKRTFVYEKNRINMKGKHVLNPEEYQEALKQLHNSVMALGNRLRNAPIVKMSDSQYRVVFQNSTMADIFGFDRLEGAIYSQLQNVLMAKPVTIKFTKHSVFLFSFMDGFEPIRIPFSALIPLMEKHGTMTQDELEQVAFSTVITGSDIGTFAAGASATWDRMPGPLGLYTIIDYTFGRNERPVFAETNVVTEKGKHYTFVPKSNFLYSKHWFVQK